MSVTKQEIVFGLENATWPAMLIDSHGTIKRASNGAISVFGKGLESGSANLSIIWSNENRVSSSQFIAQLERAIQPHHQIIYIVTGGVHVPFSTIICPIVISGVRYYIFQLLPETGQAKEKGENKTEGQSKDTDILTIHKQKLESTLQFARAVTLDFNNALTSILAHVSLLLSKIEPGNPWRKSLIEIEKSAQRAAEIAADFAAFSLREKYAKSGKTGNINDVVRRAVELFRKSADPYLKWVLHLEKNIFSVNFDEAKIQQAIIKVIENAIEALPDTRKGTISVATRNIDVKEITYDRHVKLTPGQYVCIEIKDDGCGIPADIINRVFEPFFSTKKGHRGLGLTWVYGIITNHGGHVVITSEPGLGTSVRMYLPATKKIVKDVSSSNEDLYGNNTILVVDDEELILTMAEVVLSEYGYTVLTANSGENALDIIKKHKGKIDLVITDLVMPRMSGRELVEEILKIYPNTKILCSSGFVRSSPEEEEENYLQKPFTAQELLLKVKKILSS